MLPASPVPPATLLLAAAVLLSSPAQGAEKEPASKLPYKPETTFRYVWIQGRQRVGETTFSFHPVTRDGKAAWQIRGSRSYDKGKASQRSRTTTVVLDDGTPVRFEESLDLSTINDLHAHQDAEIDIAGGKAHLKYVSNGREESPAFNDVSLPKGTFLFAAQAVEHWAVLASRIPRDEKTSAMDIFYPDFLKVYRVTFRKEAPETLPIEGNGVETTRYSFASDEGQLAGSLWLDERGRLVQIEFPDRTGKLPDLRVVLDVRVLRDDALKSGPQEPRSAAGPRSCP